MTHPEEIPEAVRPYFGHDKVSIFGDGGMPAAPPAPPGSPARRQGEIALAGAREAMEQGGARPGLRPTAARPKPSLMRRMRLEGEAALMEASMRDAVKRGEARGDPYPSGGFFWRRLFAPVYRALPWRLVSKGVTIGSGAKGWRRSK